jgi:hypothetical protein
VFEQNVTCNTALLLATGAQYWNQGDIVADCYVPCKSAIEGRDIARGPGHVGHEAGVPSVTEQDCRAVLWMIMTSNT